jgi:phosphatidylinositol glycan class C protein
MLKTLTKDIASDSIWALTTLMLLANLAFHDYGSTKSVSVEFPDSLSINAAIFASVLLASRLPLNLHVFALMSLSVQLFALFPIFSRYLRVIVLVCETTLHSLTELGDRTNPRWEAFSSVSD